MRVAERSRSKAQGYKPECYESPEWAQAKYCDLFVKKLTYLRKPGYYGQANYRHPNYLQTIIKKLHYPKRHPSNIIKQSNCI